MYLSGCFVFKRSVYDIVFVVGQFNFNMAALLLCIDVLID
ncbi:hypothetical protein HMPREF9370_1141 [Neisseria wadsworthii 9715]|uniref:Uncharacterized protein n=1 Tax=Neisseria wadsworthii 9715 TaxID=1030841 RepID=G4CPY1_9NEIS|nr:hypothetical protein HMPREF9370_1141 [Neisseria wadsworthii 9715]